MLLKLYRSPTINTFASFLCRTFGLILLLPIVLRSFTPEDFNVWSLFSVFLSLQILCDLGFCITFVRAIATALAGADSPQSFLNNSKPVSPSTPNWKLVDQIVSSMRFLYQRLAIIYLGFLVIAGSMILYRPISLTEYPALRWTAWCVIIVGGFLAFRQSYLSVLLSGLNEISLLRRSEAFIAIGSTLTGCVVLLLGGGILQLVIATQIWTVISVLRNRQLVSFVADHRFNTLPPAHRDAEMLACLWPATWRSGIGILTSIGLTQATGLINAQFVSASSSASYLLSLRIMQMVSAFSQAPFYSQLSLLPRLRAEGKIDQMLAIASRGMSRSLWIYSLAFAFVGLCGPTAFSWLGSQIEFPQTIFFLIFGSFLFIERFSSMHLLLYSTTNKIITHTANGITAIIAIVMTLGLLPYFGALALPLGLLCGYVAFYSWYPVTHSYSEFGMSFWKFEAKSSLGPLLCFIIACLLMVFIK